MHGRQPLIRISEVAIVIERAHVPVRIVEQPILEHADARGLFHVGDVLAPALDRRLTEVLAALWPAGVDLFAGLRALRAVVDLLDGIDLLLRQARRFIRAGLAHQRRWLERTL